MSNQNVRKFANNGNATVSTANPYLNGMGAIVPILAAGSQQGASGTMVQSIKITATGDSSLGAVRIFIGSAGGANIFLWREVPVGANVQTGVTKAFSATVADPFFLQSGYGLYASTENAETFNITTIANDYVNCPC